MIVLHFLLWLVVLSIKQVMHAASAVGGGIAFVLFLYWSVKASQYLRRERPLLRTFRTALDRFSVQRSDFAPDGWSHQVRGFIAIVVAVVMAIVWQVTAP
jgi:hypothetical protein